jgi:predicted helicase
VNEPDVKKALAFARRLLDVKEVTTDFDRVLMAGDLKFDNENDLQAAIDNLDVCIATA